MFTKLKILIIFTTLMLVAMPSQGGFLDKAMQDLKQNLEQGIKNTKKDYESIRSNIKEGNFVEKPFLVLTIDSRIQDFLKAQNDELTRDLYRFLVDNGFEIQPPWDTIKPYADKGTGLSSTDIFSLSRTLGHANYGYLAVGVPKYIHKLQKKETGDQYLMTVTVQFLFVPNFDVSYDLKIKKWTKVVKIERIIDSRNFEGWEFLIHPQELENLVKRQHSITNVSRIIATAFEQVYPTFPQPPPGY